MQPSSADKPSVKALSDKGLKILIGNIKGSVEELAKLISGYDTIISAIGAMQQTEQLPLVDAAALAGTKRFIPCAFMTVCPPGGIMSLRDDKEIIYQRLKEKNVPHTVIDVGFWHQISVPRVPSGKYDGHIFIPKNEVYAGGELKTLLGDKRDIGRWVGRIITDERTVNKYIYACSDALSQRDVIKIVERKTGEKVEVTEVSFFPMLGRLLGKTRTDEQMQLSDQELVARRDAARVAAIKDPNSWPLRIARSTDEYNVSKFVRGDNSPEKAKELGYLDARDLYPDFKPILFEEFIDELLEGKGVRPYAGRF